MDEKLNLIDTGFLKKLMKEKELSESEFAEKIGVSHSYVNRVMNNKRGAGKKFIYGVISVFPDVKLDQLFCSGNRLPKGNKKVNTA